MRPSPKLRPTVWDVLTAALVLVLAVGCAAAFWRGADSGGDLTAVVFADGAEQERIRLPSAGEEEREVESGGYTLRIRLAAAEVWVESADCPTQDCVHTGRISRPGQSIVCLPARVAVTLEGGDEGDGGVDAVIG